MHVSKWLAGLLALLSVAATPALAQQRFQLNDFEAATGGAQRAYPVSNVSGCTEGCADSSIGISPGMPSPADNIPPENYATPLSPQGTSDPSAANPNANFAPSSAAPAGPLLGSTFGAAGGTRGTSPNMIGDFFNVPSATFAIQAPSSMVNLGSTQLTREFGIGGFSGISRFDTILIDDRVEFQIDSVGGTALTDVVFRSLNPVNGQFATTDDVFELEIGNPDGINDAAAQAAFIQARLDDPELQAAFLAQQAAFAAANGGGTFTQSATAADGTVTIDFTGAVVTSVTGAPGDEEIDNGSGSASGTLDSSSTFLLDQAFTFTGPTLLFTPDQMILTVATPGGGSLLGRNKLSDNNSPMPRDRVFVDYNYFQSAAITRSGINVNRFTPGFEKTFNNGNMSVEMRFPMGITLDNKIIADGVSDSEANEFGDIAMIFKALLWTDYETSVSAGVGFTAPTASDVSVDLANGTKLVHIRNESYHVSPYIAALRESGPFFAQAFLIADVDVNGNPVQLNETGSGLVDAGTIQSQTLLQFDASVGAWLYQTENRFAYLNGLATTLEMHATSAVSDLDVIESSMFQVVDPSNDFDVVNLTIGGHAVFGKTVVTVGYSVPVTDDQSFDGEFRTFVNRYF